MSTIPASTAAALAIAVLLVGYGYIALDTVLDFDRTIS
jgi:hypothetical protein